MALRNLLTRCCLPLVMHFALPAVAQEQLWVRQMGTSGHDWAQALAPGHNGRVFVAGTTTGNFCGPNAGLTDSWLACFDGGGAQLWCRQLGNATGNLAHALAPDGAGGVFIAGHTFGALGGPSAGGSDAWIARYDATGEQLWIRQFGTGVHDEVYAIAPDTTGGVFVACILNDNGELDVLLTHFDGDGGRSWTCQFGSEEDEWIFALAPDGAGGVFVGGQRYALFAGGYNPWIARFSAAGTQLWIRHFGSERDDHAHAMAPDGEGGVYFAGHTNGGWLVGPPLGYFDAWLVRYDAAGAQVWGRQFGTSGWDAAKALVPAPGGGVFVAGETTGSFGDPPLWYNPTLTRFDAAGNQSWTLRMNGTDSSHPIAAAPDGAGGVFIAGFTRGDLGGPSAGETDAWLARFSACAVDWNSNGLVDSSDISSFLAAWLDALQSGSLTADFNADGSVNSIDISAFLAAWLHAVQNGC